MKDIKKETKSLIQSFEDIKENFDIESKKKKLYTLEADTTEEGFWDDQRKAKSIMQEIGGLKSEIDEIEDLQESITTIKELLDSGSIDQSFSSELKKIEKKVEKLKLSSFLSGKNDRKNAIVSIHAGQGGVEAMDWSSMLYRMYLRFCEKNEWVVETLDLSEGEEAGIKSATFRVEGSYAYGYLKGESGTHRLVRQSPFNSDNLRQTSFALVEVLPELEEVDASDIEIRDEDLEWQFYRASGHGGQNVNKVSTAVRLKHHPSGIVVTSQTQRQQEQNRQNALNLLRAKLWIRAQESEEKLKNKIKGEYRPASWGNQIRSYVLHPYKMVKDLRTEVERSDPENVLDGDLDDFIEAELMMGDN